MLRATKISKYPLDAIDTVTLDSTDRYRRRLQLRSDGGQAFLLDLPHAQLLRDGDGLVLDDGTIIKVIASPEPLLEVRGQSKQHLLTLAYQLGNRHQPAEICEDHLKIRPDPVIADMLKKLGGQVRDVTACFNPEGGAYDQAHAHGHKHD